jgi:hypothetical protein
LVIACVHPPPAQSYRSSAGICGVRNAGTKVADSAHRRDGFTWGLSLTGRGIGVVGVPNPTSMTLGPVVGTILADEFLVFFVDPQPRLTVAHQLPKATRKCLVLITEVATRD